MSTIFPENIFAVWHGSAKPQLVIADDERKGVAQIHDAFEEAEFMLDLDGVIRVANAFEKCKAVRTIRSYMQPFMSFYFLATEVGEPITYLVVGATSADEALSYAVKAFKRSSFVSLSTADAFKSLAERMLEVLESQGINGLLDLRGYKTSPLTADVF